MYGEPNFFWRDVTQHTIMDLNWYGKRILSNGNHSKCHFINIGYIVKGSAVHSIIPTAGKVQLSFPRHIDCVSPEHQYWNSFHGSISRKSIDNAIRTNRITQINLGAWKQAAIKVLSHWSERHPPRKITKC